MHSRSSPNALILLVFAFAMLWVPVGQHAFLVPHWMKLGTFMAPFLLFAAAVFRQGNPEPMHKDPSVLSLWMLVAYIVHQFEEHWVDLFGNLYAFHGSVNALLRSATGTEGPDPLTPEGIFVINTSLVWLVGAFAIWRGQRHLFMTLAMAAIIIVNAFAHIVLGAVNVAYNPGLVTSFVVFIPIAVYVYALVLRERTASVREVVASIVWSVLAHVIMVGGLVAGQVYGLFSEPVYFVALVLWSIVPVFIFSGKPTRARLGDEA